MDFDLSTQTAAVRQWTRDFTRLETPRLTIRPLRMEDDAALFEAMQSPRVNRWISGFAQPFDLSALRRWLAKRLARMDNGDGVYGAVVYRDSGVMLGFMHAVLEPDLGGTEVAIAFHELYWGKGLVEEAGFAVVSDLFDAGITPIVATTALENYSSIRALTAFNFEAVDQIDIDTPQGLRPSWLYRLDAARFGQTMILPDDATLTPVEMRQRRMALHKLCTELKARRRLT